MAFSFLLIAAIAATQGVQAAPAATSPSLATAEHPFREGRAGLPFMSPMGEPFFGRTPGEDGLTVWFEQADRNHDGSITIDEMAADAQRFFKLLDTNHDGEIDPDEITHYEDVIAPELRRGPTPTESETGQSPKVEAGGDRQGGYHGGGHGGGRGHHRGDGGEGFGGGFGGDDEASAGRFGLLAIPEPVASADADLNRGVSTEEFGKAATERFELLDMKHTGRLTLSELQNMRQSAVAAARHPRHQSSNIEQGPPAIADDPAFPPM